jgi:hypothetical protein
MLRRSAVFLRTYLSFLPSFASADAGARIIRQIFFLIYTQSKGII